MTLSLSPRLCYLTQLEDELQSLHQSRQWLEEKGRQLAQEDSGQAGEALRDVNVVKAALDYVSTLITKRSVQNTLSSSADARDMNPR